MKSKKKIGPSDLRRQAEAMIAAGTMPPLATVLKAIAEVRAESMVLLELSAADILFLKTCGIAVDEVPEDTRWEIDADAEAEMDADAVSSTGSDCEAAE
jgi:hypothetical protein